LNGNTRGPADHIRAFILMATRRLELVKLILVGNVIGSSEFPDLDIPADDRTQFLYVFPSKFSDEVKILMPNPFRVFEIGAFPSQELTNGQDTGRISAADTDPRSNHRHLQIR